MFVNKFVFFVIQAHCRLIKCAIALYELEDMEKSVAKLKILDPSNKILSYQEQQMQQFHIHLQNEKIASAEKNYTLVNL